MDKAIDLIGGSGAALASLICFAAAIVMPSAVAATMGIFCAAGSIYLIRKARLN